LNVSQVKWNVEHLDHVDSTNTWLAARARDGADEGHVVYCDFQSAGRGRRDRVWIASAGSSLLCSVLLIPPVFLEAPQMMIVAAALSVCDSLEQLTHVRPTLKWPNDVLFGDLKVAGLLAEVIPTETVPKVVIGLGVNLTDVDPAFESATSVLSATGAALAPSRVLRVYLDELGRRREMMSTERGLATLGQHYVGALSTIGRRVRVELVDGQVRGRAVGVDETGALRVDTGSEVRTFTAGDVVHVRGEEEE
jgi:BirA family biotin operon repressor/biotin-[acetyl-CoA-carboxylase] ligase